MLSKLVFTALLLGLLAAFVASSKGAHDGSLAPGDKNEKNVPWCHEKCTYHANMTDADYIKYKCVGPCKLRVPTLPPSVTHKPVHGGPTLPLSVTNKPVHGGSTLPPSVTNKPVHGGSTLPPSVTNKPGHGGPSAPVKNGDTVPWCNEYCTKGKLSEADFNKYKCYLQCKEVPKLPTNLPH